MAKSLPFATQDNQYPFSYLRMGQLGYNSPGVVLAGDMQVSPGTGLQVQISAGEAYVQQTVARLGSFYASRGIYYIFDDAVDNPYNTITAPVTYPRVDQVIARIYDSYEQQLSGSSYWRYEWLPGTETSGADLTNLDGAATLPANSLRLAYGLATVGMSSWSSGNIENALPTLYAVTQPSRTPATPYQPNTTRPTLVIAYVGVTSGSPNAPLSIGPTSSPTTEVADLYYPAASGTLVGTLVALVPPGWYYQIGASSTTPAVTEITL